METKINTGRSGGKAAFTLIELLVVIAVIGILAAMISHLSGPAAIKRKIARVTVELAQLETAIDSYKEAKGFYPPSNADTNNSVTNQLFYELSGTGYDVANNKFFTIKGDESITTNSLRTYFGVDGLANSSTDKSEVKNFFTGMKPSQYGELVSSPEVELMLVPVEGPTDIVAANGKKINPWRYNSSAPVHNPETYDLWAEIVIGGKTNVIGNWKE
ncbi:MAG: type II secretion system protein [Verrucomicrobiota bacterium]